MGGFIRVSREFSGTAARAVLEEHKGEQKEGEYEGKEQGTGTTEASVRGDACD